MADRVGEVSILHQVEGPGGVVLARDKVFVQERPTVPVARFRWSPKEIHSGDTVQFIDESTGSPAKWLWEITGRPPQTNRNPDITFAKPGKVTVKLSIERDGLKSETAPAEIDVLPKVVNLQVIIDANPRKGRVPLTVSFTDKSKGNISAWRWDFGDGKSSDLQNPVHEYESAATYIPRLTIRNSRGEEARDAGDISIEAIPPPAPMPLWLKLLLWLAAALSRQAPRSGSTT